MTSEKLEDTEGLSYKGHMTNQALLHQNKLYLSGCNLCSHTRCRVHDLPQVDRNLTCHHT